MLLVVDGVSLMFCFEETAEQLGVDLSEILVETGGKIGENSKPCAVCLC